MQNYWLLRTIFLLQCSIVFGGIGTRYNLTEFLKHRQKRSLIWTGGGVAKLAIGPVFPLQLDDGINWRQSIAFCNFQGGQYPLPTAPLYPWDKWEHTFARSLQREREEFELTGKYKVDNSRLFAYKALESYMDRQNANGKDCLLRSICENAQVDEHLGILAEMINILLTPGNDAMDAIYNEAYVAGKSRANCLKLFHKCPAGANVLDQYMEEL